jgi:DNA ligase 1
MRVINILEEIKSVPGSNAKKVILQNNSENQLLKNVLKYGMDSFTPFNLVKVPKTKKRFPIDNELNRWKAFFDVADLCAERTYTGNFAIQMMSDVFCIVEEDEEKWMRKILKKHLSIGASTKTVNKIFPGLIPTFEVSLAQKFEEKRIIGKEFVGVEPKLDGIRCFAIVQDEKALLFARSGKLIPNFDSTIGKELLKLGDGCYDGELMGEDFVAIMRQAYRKESVDTSGTYISLFDFLPLNEWKTGNAIMSCHDRHEKLLDMLADSTVDMDIVRPVERAHVAACYDDIKQLHDEFVSDGYEGAMIKDLEAPYKFGRGYEIMKMKEFHDVDLVIRSLLEGTGKYKGKLGSVSVNFNGVDVSIGSGFSDDLRDEIWENKDEFVGRMIEIRYQEVTPDGSLRFPTFVCFRNDRQ